MEISILKIKGNKMTKTQFNEIKEILSKWREERHLTYENQQAEFLGNVFEKVSEYFRAKNDLEKIDAICDIVIYFFNAFDFKYIAVSSNMYYYTFSDVVVYNIYSLFGARTDNLCVVENENDFINLEKNLNLTMFEIEQLCKNLGFDFYKCMLEKIKEIESRTGFYDESLNKFIKDEGYYSVAHLKNEIKLPKTYEIINVIEEKDLFLVKIKTPNTILTNKFKKWYKVDYEKVAGYKN